MAGNWRGNSQKRGNSQRWSGNPRQFAGGPDMMEGMPNCWIYEPPLADTVKVFLTVETFVRPFVNVVEHEIKYPELVQLGAAVRDGDGGSLHLAFKPKQFTSSAIKKRKHIKIMDKWKVRFDEDMTEAVWLPNYPRSGGEVKAVHVAHGLELLRKFVQGHVEKKKVALVFYSFMEAACFILAIQHSESPRSLKAAIGGSISFICFVQHSIHNERTMYQMNYCYRSDGSMKLTAESLMQNIHRHPVFFQPFELFQRRNIHAMMIDRMRIIECEPFLLSCNEMPQRKNKNKKQAIVEQMLMARFDMLKRLQNWPRSMYLGEQLQIKTREIHENDPECKFHAEPFQGIYDLPPINSGVGRGNTSFYDDELEKQLKASSLEDLEKLAQSYDEKIKKFYRNDGYLLWCYDKINKFAKQEQEYQRMEAKRKALEEESAQKKMKVDSDQDRMSEDPEMVNSNSETVDLTQLEEMERRVLNQMEDLKKELQRIRALKAKHKIN